MVWTGDGWWTVGSLLMDVAPLVNGDILRDRARRQKGEGRLHSWHVLNLGKFFCALCHFNRLMSLNLKCEVLPLCLEGGGSICDVTLAVWYMAYSA